MIQLNTGPTHHLRQTASIQPGAHTASDITADKRQRVCTQPKGSRLRLRGTPCSRLAS